MIDFNKIETDLTASAERKKERNIIIANEEIKAATRECEAYWNGVYDALKAVKGAIEREETEK